MPLWEACSSLVLGDALSSGEESFSVPRVLGVCLNGLRRGLNCFRPFAQQEMEGREEWRLADSDRMRSETRKDEDFYLLGTLGWEHRPSFDHKEWNR